MLLMDTNLIENSIRPIALGRNNYLFAGSHAAAQNAAIIYSLFATCKLHDVKCLRMAEACAHCYANVPSIQDQRTASSELEPANHYSIVTNKSKSTYRIRELTFRCTCNQLKQHL